MSPPHQPPGPASPDQGGSLAASGMSTLPALRVLCAEDDATIAAVVRIALELRGHHVEMVANGRLALEKMDAKPTAYDVLLTDHDMPTMDGLGLVTRVRASGHLVGLVVHSSSLALRDRQAYQRLGVTEFLSKPCELDRLLDALHRAASHSSSGRIDRA